MNLYRLVNDKLVVGIFENDTMKNINLTVWINPEKNGSWGGEFMKNDIEHKLYMGFGGFMMRIPPLLSEKGAKQGAKCARTTADCLSKEERCVHHFIVRKMAVVKDPVTAELIANELRMPNGLVLEIIDKLENLKTFIYRSDGQGINWAYPISLENTGFQMTASSGEQFFAA